MVSFSAAPATYPNLKYDPINGMQPIGLAGGTLSNFAQWIPGRIVSESVDPFHMTSVAYFETWGREPAERILSRFDGGVVRVPEAKTSG